MEFARSLPTATWTPVAPYSYPYRCTDAQATPSSSVTESVGAWRGGLIQNRCTFRGAVRTNCGQRQNYFVVCGFTESWGSDKFSSEKRGERVVGRARKGPKGGGGSYPLPKRQNETESDSDLDFDDFFDEETGTSLDLPFQTDLAVLPRHYECVFLIHEDSFEEVPEIIQKVKDKIAKFKGTVWRLNDWGLRKMAYKIKKTWKANYILLNVEVLPPQINEFEKMLLDDERIIRHLIFKMKGPETEDFPPPPTWEQITRGEDSVDEEEEEEEEDEEEVKNRTVGSGGSQRKQ